MVNRWFVLPSKGLQRNLTGGSILLQEVARGEVLHHQLVFFLGFLFLRDIVVDRWSLDVRVDNQLAVLLIFVICLFWIIALRLRER